jgi:hypothetical protein
MGQIRIISCNRCGATDRYPLKGWVKGIDIPMVGSLKVYGIDDVDICPTCVRVLKDTIERFMFGAVVQQPKPKCKHENIVGNGAAFFCLNCQQGYWAILKDEMTIEEAQQQFPGRVFRTK